ncbi:MAG TPA: ribosome-associated translation inhibitor RaiA [Candidatus Paceibacterota bacterium]|nr:ribosome-associated translation inhibitor RaiA [Candidatus Paceibacterota bacterium]
MNISIKATGIELTPAIKDYAEKRLKSISKFTDGEPTLMVEIGKATSHHKQGEIFEARVNVTTPLGKHYYAISEKADLYEAIDDIRAEVVHEITAAKGKQESVFRRGARKFKNMIRGLR